MTTRVYCDGCSVTLTEHNYCQLYVAARNSQKENVIKLTYDLCECCLGLFKQDFERHHHFLPEPMGIGLKREMA